MRWAKERRARIDEGSKRRTTAASQISNLSNSLPAKRGFKIASLNVNSLKNRINDLR